MTACLDILHPQDAKWSDGKDVTANDLFIPGEGSLIRQQPPIMRITLIS